ncbi:hypothetical protein J2S54_002863 [Streptomyces sp. DSM 42143]|nr:hypothetical protein [Streptomyces sp. DSM 42143]
MTESDTEGNHEGVGAWPVGGVRGRRHGGR